MQELILYDGFVSKSVAESKWTIASAPLGDGAFWYWKDDNAAVEAGGGYATIRIPRFSLSHDQVQIFDNPKHLYLATRSWETAGGPLAFKTKLAGECTGDPEDYRDGFASFTVLDFERAMVFDIVTNGHHVWAIYERLLIPGLTIPEQAFTEVVDLGVPTEPMKEHEIEIAFDAASARASFSVDGAVRLTRDNVPAIPRQLTCGFGLITLRPIENGKSVSCLGQGGTCKLGAVWVRG